MPLDNDSIFYLAVLIDNVKMTDEDFSKKMREVN